jgi:hypothetical protein
MMRASIALALLVFAPATAYAACGSTAALTYDDVTYVRFTQFALVGQTHPWFTYESTFYRDTPTRGTYASATVDAKRATKFIGVYAAVDALATSEAILHVLQHHAFFQLRLSTTNKLYLDGPEDSITVVRCGVTTTLSTTPYGSEIDLSDANAKAFFDLESDLRDSIFVQKWVMRRNG